MNAAERAALEQRLADGLGAAVLDLRQAFPGFACVVAIVIPGGDTRKSVSYLAHNLGDPERAAVADMLTNRDGEHVTPHAVFVAERPAGPVS